MLLEILRIKIIPRGKIRPNPIFLQPSEIIFKSMSIEERKLLC